MLPLGFALIALHIPIGIAMAMAGFVGFGLLVGWNPAISLLASGPVAVISSLDLAEVALDVAAGPEVGEDVAWRLALPAARHERLPAFRVAILPALDWMPLDTEIATALEALASRLGRLGCTVKRAQPEGLGDHREFFALYLTLLSAITTARMPVEQRRATAETMRTRDDEWSRATQRGIEAGAPDYLLWIGRREQIRAAWRAFFREWDVLLVPAFLTVAYPHWDKPTPATPESIRKTLDVNGAPALETLGLFYPAVATVPGQPATAFPVGRTRSGLPIGLQAIGPYLEDRTPIRFAALVAREIGGFTPPRGYAAD